MASSAVGFLERMLERAPASALARVGLSPDQVREQLRARPVMTADQARRAVARAVPKMAYRKIGLPSYVVAAIFADYQRLGSTAKVGELYGRSKQAIQKILRGHGYNLQPNPKAPKHERATYRGKVYTRHQGRYFAAVSPDHTPLHRQVWEDANGAVPAGMEIAFADGDPRNWDLNNLVCVPRGSTGRRAVKS